MMHLERMVNTQRREWLQRVGVMMAGCALTDAAQTASSAMPVIPDVRLLDEQSREHSLRSLMESHTVAINFIYTGCSSFCPPQTAVFKAVQSRMNEALRGASYAPLLMSISIDPLNDTPETLARYAARFEARLGLKQRWMMFTGEPGAIAQTARAFYAASVSGTRVEDHPAQIWIGCAPRARWRSIASLPSADDVLRLMKEAAA